MDSFGDYLGAQQMQTIIHHLEQRDHAPTTIYYQSSEGRQKVLKGHKIGEQGDFSEFVALAHSHDKKVRYIRIPNRSIEKMVRITDH